MEFSLIILCSIPILLVILWCYNMILLRKRYPPGPFPLPLIGNLHLLRKDIHLSMDKLSRTYGDMFTLWMANIPYVVITDSELARKVCLTTKFADRLPLYVGEQVYTRGAKDMIMADFTTPLKIHRKLARNAFELFGENFYKLESKVLYNVEKLVTKLSAFNKNDDVNVCSEIYLSCFNVIWSFVFGDNMSVKEEWYDKIKNTITMMTQSGVVFSFVNFYPILRYLPNPELSEMNSIIEERDVVLEKVINMAEKAYLEKKNKSTTIKTYTEALLKAKDEYEKDDKNAEDVYSRDHLEMNVFDMFLGGVESTNTSFQWTIMYLVKWPHIQLKCHEEIDVVMAEDRARLVQLKHKQRMPYVQAVILESLRMASPFPFGVFHKARVTAELNGYTIEKGTATMINIWTIHHKEKYYKDPFEFQPERFLDANGQLLEKKYLKDFFAFSIGPRECIGQTFAKNEMFLFIANLLYKFKFANSPNQKLDLFGNTKVTHAPKPFCVKVTPRHDNSYAI